MMPNVKIFQKISCKLSFGGQLFLLPSLKLKACNAVLNLLIFATYTGQFLGRASKFDNSFWKSASNTDEINLAESALLILTQMIWLSNFP